MLTPDLNKPTRCPVNRRERKKQETRAALEQAALRLFDEKGYEQTTVEEIAAAADVAVRTFFRYFSSKQHVLFGDVGHQRINQLRSALVVIPPEQAPLDAVRTVLDTLDLGPDEAEHVGGRLRLMQRQPSMVGMYLRLNYELRQTLVQFVAGRTGLPATHPYPLLVATAAVASWDVALHAWLAEGGRRAMSELRREAFAALTTGIPAHPSDPVQPSDPPSARLS